MKTAPVESLKDLYPSLDYLIQRGLGTSAEEYMKTLETLHEDPKKMGRYTNGWLLPHLNGLRLQDKLRKG